MSARVGFEPAMLRAQGTELTNEPPGPINSFFKTFLIISYYLQCRLIIVALCFGVMVEHLMLSAFKVFVVECSLKIVNRFSLKLMFEVLYL